MWRQQAVQRSRVFDLLLEHRHNARAAADRRTAHKDASGARCRVRQLHRNDDRTVACDGDRRQVVADPVVSSVSAASIA